MFWLGSVNRTAGLPFFTQIRFRLKHRRWGKLNRITRSRRREQTLSLFLSFHALPNLVQKRVQSRAQQQVKLHRSIYLFICLSYPYIFESVLLKKNCRLLKPYFCIFLLCVTFGSIFVLLNNVCQTVCKSHSVKSAWHITPC